ncbi:MAG: hypothetical protein PUD22_02010 [Erysipelotrichaceae bacterium]|nr:hypothetical protein [Erysipelotrichaceae bacterium]
MTDKKIISDSINNAPESVKCCLEDCVHRIEREEERNGAFASIDDFIDRMLNADMDIHAFSIIGEYLTITFPGNGNASMLRAVIALRGLDPDYAILPEIEVYAKNYEAEDDDEILPFD